MSRQRTILVLAVASQAAFSMITFGLPAIGVEIRERFDLGPAGFGAVFAAVGVGSAAALIPAGALVDRFGGRRMLVVGGIVNGIGLLLAASAGTAPTYAAALVLAGIGGAAVPVAGMTALLRVFEPEKRGMAMGWRQLGVPLGGTLGAAVLPALAALGGVRLAMAGAGRGRDGHRARVRRRLGRAPGRRSMQLAWAERRGRPSHPRVQAAPGGRAALRPRSGRDPGPLRRRAPRRRPLPRRGGGRVRRTQHHRRALTAGVGAAGRRRRRDPAGADAARDRHPDRLRLVRHAGRALGRRPAALVAGVVLAFGAFGFNGVLYLLAGELAGSTRAGRAVGIASTVVFGMGALAAPIAGVAIERTGYDAVWVMSAVAAAAGAITARRWLEPAAVVAAEAEVVQIAAPAR